MTFPFSYALNFLYEPTVSHVRVRFLQHLLYLKNTPQTFAAAAPPPTLPTILQIALICVAHRHSATAITALNRIAIIARVAKLQAILSGADLSKY